MDKRKDIIRARKEMLGRLSDKDLMDSIIAYFAKHSTMPGERKLKEEAYLFAAQLKEGYKKGLDKETRQEMEEKFASVLVKETKVKYVKRHVEKADTLQMALTNMEPHEHFGTVDSYELPVAVSSDGQVCTEDGKTIGSLPEGFRDNHAKVLDGMKAMVVATDWSRSKLANMSYSLIIDFGQCACQAV